MHDWRKLVSERLGHLGLRPEREEEIRAELADHLEDQGREDSKVDGTDWSLLAREIRNAEEGEMSPTAKTLWVPGLGMLSCSLFVLMAITNFWDTRTPFMLMALWLLAYLAFGALGAWWSRRAGGGPLARFLSGTSPLAMHVAVFIIATISIQRTDLLRHGLLWVLIPGVTLAIGTLPFLRDPQRRDDAG